MPQKFTTPSGKPDRAAQQDGVGQKLFGQVLSPESGIGPVVELPARRDYPRRRINPTGAALSTSAA
jgi:hypothetical protein